MVMAKVASRTPNTKDLFKEFLTTYQEGKFDNKRSQKYYYKQFSSLDKQISKDKDAKKKLKKDIKKLKKKIKEPNSSTSNSSDWT